MGQITTYRASVYYLSINKLCTRLGCHRQFLHLLLLIILRNNPMCTCGKLDSLRTSNTPTNSGRSFFGCPKDYHTSTISNGSIAVRKEKKEFVKIEIELLRKEEELRKKE
ncbi:hypothetical protein F2P56_003945 [Juglans regia]|uniref:GRF-type domain-containing protein n=2 Tax=Juglans regia TaxID=51240 RepID=A0A834D510_JUGRE|nr:uncharacterized protein LOC108981154 [Juglans regia]KAF5477295.1 hypothetical protein F2P56_003945 [Juglans regia]